MEVGLKNGEPKCKKFDPLNYGTQAIRCKKNAAKKLLLCGLVVKI